MDATKYRLLNSDIQFYDRPATGYQVILLPPLNDRYWTLSKIYEYEDGSPYPYPPPNEARARQMAVDYAITAITDHWDRSAGATGNSTGN